MEEYVITTRNLTKKYHNFTAVDNVSLSVHKGAIYGLMVVTEQEKLH